MRNPFIIFLLSLSYFSTLAQNTYRYTIDLENVVNDRVKVTLECPEISENKAEFVMPRVIPGSYSWKEYGRFLSEVKAFDDNGKAIKITNKKNLFYINKKASKLAKIEYSGRRYLDDTNVKQFIFQPGGSNIEAGKNFVLNHHAFLGYFEGYKNLPFEVEIKKPQEMWGATWLPKYVQSSTLDLLKAENYFQLADNPAMYCKPDTNSFQIDDTRIYISSYSNNGIVKADSLREWLKPLAYSLKNFMGELPVSEYYFLYYFASNDQVMKVPSGQGLSGYGALEHHHSSFYFLPELEDSEKVREMVQDVGAHEFLHILTPLNLHSKEIADFNFKDPEMSQHLWLYEGVTEYFSWLVRIQNGMVTEQAFFDEMNKKLNRSAEYGSFSFTEMSKNVLQPDYQEKYADVYLKGAIMAMMLDQLLLHKSDGSYGLLHLMKDLMAKYGPHQPFDDDKIFEEIASKTFPEVGEFFDKYIIGKDELPLAQYMDWFGYQYEREKRIKAYYVASLSLRLNDKNQIEAVEVQGSTLGLKNKDILLEVDNIPISISNIEEIWENYFLYNASPNTIALKVLRNGQELNYQESPLKVRLLKGINSQRFINPRVRQIVFVTLGLKGNI